MPPGVVKEASLTHSAWPSPAAVGRQLWRASVALLGLAGAAGWPPPAGGAAAAGGAFPDRWRGVGGLPAPAAPPPRPPAGRFFVGPPRPRRLGSEARGLARAQRRWHDVERCLVTLQAAHAGRLPILEQAFGAAGRDAAGTLLAAIVAVEGDSERAGAALADTPLGGRSRQAHHLVRRLASLASSADHRLQRAGPAADVLVALEARLAAESGGGRPDGDLERALAALRAALREPA